MAEKILGPQGSTRRRRFLWVPMLLIACSALFLIGSAQAVHDTGLFELDGNATNAAAIPGDDWDNVCHQVVGSDCSTTSDTTGSSAVSFVAEPNLNSTIFTGGGSKDPQDISQWAWKDGAGGLPDKDNLLHAFAVRYQTTPSTTCPAGTASVCDVLYFGSDRYDNSGDAQQGFWFFQNAVGLGNTPVGGGTGFTGVHKTGDILVISDFSNGGTTSTITVYKWNPSCSKTGQVLGNGDVCGDQNLEQLETSANSKCSAALGTGDAFCGIVNPTDGTAAPWSFTDKSGLHTFLNGEFYEGGINLSTLGLSGECFAAMASETRSSTSTTATLKDFVLGGFGHCDSGTVTTPSAGSDGSNSIGTGSVSESDKAVVTVTGATGFGGSVTFSLCGPTPLTDANYTLCTSGGTTVGSSKPVSGTSPVTVNSDAASVTSVGRYCWRADYSGDSSKSVPASSDSSASECFKVTPVTPTLGTTAGAGPVALGHSISDTASLSGTANKPGTPVINPTTAGAPAGGSITFTAYGPNDCSTVAFTSSAVGVSGDGTYGPVSFTPSHAGTYHWVASYTGDSPNTNGTDHNTGCTDTGEDVVVSPAPTTITTRQSIFPQDKAKITASAGGDLAGSVTFALYDTLANCNTGGATGQLYTEGPLAISGPSGQTAATNNQSVRVSTSTTVYWRVTYASTNNDQNGTSSTCTENTQVTYTGNDTGISLP